jgi:ABC-type uncharacterized transport system permease subunit
MMPGLVGTPLPTRQRHNGFVALAVALIVGLAAIGAYLYSSAGSTTLVVMVVGEVPAGQVIERSDLTTVPVSGRVTAFGADRLDGLVGQRARVTLLPDMFLQRSMVKDGGESLPAGQAEVGVAVRSGQVPADGLAPGDTVQIVQLAAGQDAVGQARVLVEQALVFSSRPDESVVGGTLLTVVVPTSASTAVAAASGAGQVALVRVPGR